MSLPSGMIILFQPARALVDGLHATCKSKLIKILEKHKVTLCREDCMHITNWITWRKVDKSFQIAPHEQQLMQQLTVKYSLPRYN